jgi:hypothetical protein
MTKSRKKLGVSAIEPHIGKVPKAKKEKTPRGTLRYGEFYPNSKLRYRYEGTHEVAPEYFGDPSLSLCERLPLAFAEADKHKQLAVVVDGVLYPKLDSGEWYKWKRPREVYELFLREQGLPDSEVFIRLHIQQYESAKSDLIAVFNWKAPEDWDESLRFHRAMPRTPETERKIIVLETAIKARAFLEEREAS